MSRVGIRSCRGSRNGMSEPQEIRSLLDLAEGAAVAGDFAAADELLRRVARIQETELGPLHPDLADTLNNLAIVAEKTGRPDDAETFYRRAVAIASTLPPGDPRVAASRQNLEDFCRARGVPLDRPRAAAAPAQPRIAAVSDAAPTQSIEPTPSARRGGLPTAAKIALGVVVLAVAGLLVEQPWSTREPPPQRTASETTTPAPPVEHASPQATAPAPPQPAAPAPEKTPAPKAVPPSGGVALASVQLCRRFSTNDGSWRCDPAGASVAPGPIVLYTRVRSPRDATIVHRWFRGDTLRQSVRLPVRANATEGYRTYSRQTVDTGDWRVEVRSTAGDLLHEQHLSVK
jgi:hypothetical protein